MAAFVVAAAARWAGALRTSGAAAAFGVGFVIFGWGGLGGALPLLLFFVSASALTRLRLRRRTAPSDDAGADDAVGRGGMQVVANGIVPSAALLGFARWPHPGWLLAFAGALAAVTADTWATELGGFSRRPPVLVTTGERVAPGRSGGMSALGTAGGVLGAVVLAAGASGALAHWPVGDAFGLLAAGPVPGTWRFGAAVVCGGVAGMVADSVLGATVQGRYRCPKCKTETEVQVHRCGRPTEPVAGFPFVTNDVVNLAAAVVGGLVAATVGTGLLGNGL